MSRSTASESFETAEEEDEKRFIPNVIIESIAVAKVRNTVKVISTRYIFNQQYQFKEKQKAWVDEKKF